MQRRAIDILPTEAHLIFQRAITHHLEFLLLLTAMRCQPLLIFKFRLIGLWLLATHDDFLVESKRGRIRRVVIHSGRIDHFG